MKQLVDPAFAPQKTGIPFHNKLKDFDFNKDNIKRRANQKTKPLIPSHKKCYRGCRKVKKACLREVRKHCKKTKKKNRKLVTVICHIKNGAGARLCDTAYAKCRRKCKKSKLMQEEQPALEQTLQSCKKYKCGKKKDKCIRKCAQFADPAFQVRHVKPLPFGKKMPDPAFTAKKRNSSCRKHCEVTARICKDARKKCKKQAKKQAKSTVTQLDSSVIPGGAVVPESDFQEAW